MRGLFHAESNSLQVVLYRRVPPTCARVFYLPYPHALLIGTRSLRGMSRLCASLRGDGCLARPQAVPSSEGGPPIPRPRPLFTRAIDGSAFLFLLFHPCFACVQASHSPLPLYPSPPPRVALARCMRHLAVPSSRHRLHHRAPCRHMCHVAMPVAAVHAANLAAITTMTVATTPKYMTTTTTTTMSTTTL